MQLNQKTYLEMYRQSIDNPELFWGNQAEHFVSWFKPWKKVMDCDFATGKIEWFQDGQLNASVNCVDRHLKDKSNVPAILWESDNLHRSKQITYQQLYEKVGRFTNVLRSLGVKKGDRVCLYMPMIPDAVVAMLACARMGAIHSIVFAGFSAKALKQRIRDLNCKVVITVDEGIRAGKIVPLKHTVDEAIEYLHVRDVVVFKNSGNAVSMRHKRDKWYHELSLHQSSTAAPEIMDAEDPLFVLYTSGSTGIPKGVLHTTGGYLVYAAMTHRYAFDYRSDDIFWCTADIGWITGHTYGVYGPLTNGATLVMYEGVPTGDDPSLTWKIVDKYQVSVFYTAPTMIRALMAHGDEGLKNSHRTSLRVLGSVGEPINPEAWKWYHDKVGQGRCGIVDTWWQTETGGALIAPWPGVGRQKPGCAGLPFFGVVPEVVNEKGEAVKPNEHGFLLIKQSWPGQMRTIYNNSIRFMKGYFAQHPGKYFTGDGAYCDEDGDYWLTGRVDDVINVSGHRLGTAEIESALVAHPLVVEAAVVGIPHPVKGEALYAVVTLIAGEAWKPSLEPELKKWVGEIIGKFAMPENIQMAAKLPKTRSGKIMRRILRCIAMGEVDKMGDISTLAEPEVIQALLKSKV